MARIYHRILDLHRNIIGPVCVCWSMGTLTAIRPTPLITAWRLTLMDLAMMGLKVKVIGQMPRSKSKIMSSAYCHKVIKDEVIGQRLPRLIKVKGYPC